MKITTMKTFSLASAAALAMLLSGGSASASSATGTFAVRGLGSEKCQAFTTAISAKSPALQSHASWIMGYASAYNRATPKIFDAYPLPAGSGLVSLVAAICAANPNIALEAATAQLFATIAPLSLAADTPLVSFGSGAKTLSVRESSVRQLEQALTDRGLFKGKVSGKSSPQLIEAIQAFQKSQGMPVTGLPDMQTLVRAVLKKS